MDEAAFSRDAFLGGRLQVWQPRRGYRAGVDPVLLAAAVDAQPGQAVLDLGCGVGVASLCLGARVGPLRLHGVEVQPEYAALARLNAQAAGLDFTVTTGDLAALPAELRMQRFDHVIANPPYFDRSNSVAAKDAGREVAMGEGLALTDWVAVAARRVVDGGYVTFINRAERLPDLLAAMLARLGSVVALPLTPRRGRDAQLVLLRGRKGGRAAFRLADPVLMHDGAVHQRDGEDYAPVIRAVLRDGAALPF